MRIVERKVWILPLRIAVAQSWTWTSGIFDASCIAGVTMFMDSRLLPRDRNMWPKRTRLQDVSLLRSSEFAIFNVSRRYRLEKFINLICIIIFQHYCYAKLMFLRSSIQFIFIISGSMRESASLGWRMPWATRLLSKTMKVKIMIW